MYVIKISKTHFSSIESNTSDLYKQGHRDKYFYLKSNTRLIANKNDN